MKMKLLFLITILNILTCKGQYHDKINNYILNDKNFQKEIIDFWNIDSKKFKLFPTPEVFVFGNLSQFENSKVIKKNEFDTFKTEYIKTIDSIFIVHECELKIHCIRNCCNDAYYMTIEEFINNYYSNNVVRYGLNNSYQIAYLDTTQLVLFDRSINLKEWSRKKPALSFYKGKYVIAYSHVIGQYQAAIIKPLHPGIYSFGLFGYINVGRAPIVMYFKYSKSGEIANVIYCWPEEPFNL